jgi:UDP-2-acetamido-3-amino-2,3-dideoxy-glucuronate N-acetyltransferase
MIHLLADVQSEKIGKNTTIWQFSIVLKGAEIGENCNINCHTFIENDVKIGNNVTVKSGVFLWDGITIGNNVFIGPNVTFTNDNTPRSKQYPINFQRISIENYASIGANATVMGGISIGKFALIGAGALVTKDIPERALVVGSPARIVGWLNDDGSKMYLEDKGIYRDDKGNKWHIDNGKLLQIK